MRVIGMLLSVVGLFWLIYASSIETSVEVSSTGLFGLTETSRVHNLAKADEKRNQIMLGALTLLIGVVTVGFSFRGGSPESSNPSQSPTSKDKKCPFCAEYIKKEAKICRYCGKEQPEIDYTPKLRGKITTDEVFKLKVSTQGTLNCPGCGEFLKLDTTELATRKFKCGTCDSTVNFSTT